jgi:hypothetical protein
MTLEEAQALIEAGFEYLTDAKVGETTYKLLGKKESWQPT